MELLETSRDLSAALSRLRFGAPTTHVYDPLDYAWAPHAAYLERFGAARPREVLLLGMNPGPFGMAQTGVPFGEVAAVRDWLGITAHVSRPRDEHPKRPIEGFACRRSEVSGARLWGWARARFETPERFFERFFVLNYCPLVFMEESGKNRTPDKLPAEERAPLHELCDEALARALRYFEPRVLVGVGAFAEARLRAVSERIGSEARIGRILHPSPASPMANRGWATAVDADLAALGVNVP
jgi:single-strand selective monofunctional uracil DNA glycosylase